MHKEIKLKNENNENIFVEVYGKKKKNTLILCHGITGCRKGRTREDNYFQELAKKLTDKDYKVVLFDFSGHGDSEGNDKDVTLSKSTKELELVFNNEVEDKNNISFLAFSYGATVLCNFLKENQNIKPKKIVLYSPCLYPIESCFLNEDSVFGKDIVNAFKTGEMKKNGYAVVGAKNFKVGKDLIEECEEFYPDYLSNFALNTLVLSGKQDVILNTKYNDDFCEASHMENIYLDASHSLFECIDEAFDLTINYLTKEGEK